MKKYSTANLRLTNGMDLLTRKLTAFNHGRLGCACFQLCDSGMTLSMTKWRLKLVRKPSKDWTLLNSSEMWAFRWPKLV